MKRLRNKFHFHMLLSHHSEFPPTIENCRSPTLLNPHGSNFVIGERALAIGSIGDFPRARGPINRICLIPAGKRRLGWGAPQRMYRGGEGKALYVDPCGTLEPRGWFFHGLIWVRLLRKIRRISVGI